MSKAQSKETKTEENQTIKKEENTNTQRPTYNTVPIAIAIVVAGGLIGGAIFLSSSFNRSPAQPGSQLGTTTQGHQAPQQAELANNMQAVSADDHVRGTDNAKIYLVEYSDLDCPFCGRVHDTLKQIIQQYDGEVSWIYRHFPLTSLHPHAEVKAQAAECVAELGGAEAFWDFTDAYFVAQDPRIGLESAVSVASSLGINSAALNSCVSSGKYGNKVQAQFEDAVESGGRGTPYIIITNGEEFIPVEGAQPASSFTTHIDELLGN